MKLKDLTENVNTNLDSFTTKNDLKELTYLGSGDFGTAYLTDKNTVVKITKDKTEYDIAIKLKGHNLQNVVSIYDADKIGTDMFIHMELLITDGIEDLYSKMQHIIEDELNLSLGEVLYHDADYEGAAEELNINIPEYVSTLLQNINYGLYELSKFGLTTVDIRSENIGKKRNGNFALFDLSVHKLRL